MNISKIGSGDRTYKHIIIFIEKNLRIPIPFDHRACKIVIEFFLEVYMYSSVFGRIRCDPFAVIKRSQMKRSDNAVIHVEGGGIREIAQHEVFCHAARGHVALVEMNLHVGADELLCQTGCLVVVTHRGVSLKRWQPRQRRQYL